MNRSPDRNSPTRRLTGFTVTLIGLLLALPAIEGFAQQYPFIPIGGPDAPKGCLIPFQDTRGGLWLAECEGQTGGLFYFDGSRFFSPVKGSSMMGTVSGMAEDTDGGLWISSDSGLYRLYNSGLRLIRKGAVAGIAQIAPDVFLAAVEKQVKGAPDAELVRISNDRVGWRTEAILDSFPYVQFSLDHNGSILYGCPGGFCELRTNDVIRWVPGTALAVQHHEASIGYDYATDASLVSRDRLRCVWMRSGFEASYQCPGDGKPTTLPKTIAARGPTMLFEMSDGSMIIPSYSQLAIGRPGRFRVLGAINGFPSSGPALLLHDGTLLLTGSTGLHIAPLQSRMEFWSALQGLDGNTWSVVRLGSHMFAVAGDTIRELDRDRSRWLPWATVNDATRLIAGPENSILSGSLTRGVVELDEKGAVLRRSVPASISTLVQASDGSFWAAGSDLFKVVISGQELRLEPSGAPAPEDHGSDMKVDRDGQVWSCSSAGLAHQDLSGWRVLSTNGGPHNQCRSFAIEQNGDIWYSYSDGDRLALIRNPGGTRPSFEYFQGGGELGLALSSFLDFDRRGWLWRGTPDGVYVATPEDARRDQWLRLDQMDGLPAVDTNRGSFFEDADGSVWFGADNSVIHLSPTDDLLHPKYAPSIFISAFSWNGVAPQMADLVGDIKARSNITAYIGSLQFDRRNNLRLRYRLLPDQRSWRETSNLDLALGKLSQGSHTLEVQGRIFTGPWSDTVSRSFTVLPPVGLTWPFILGYIVLGISLPLGWYLLQRRRKDEEAVLLPDLAAWRLGALHADVGELAGTVLDSRFEVGQLLARGGFANVMSGFDRAQQQRCAIKVFRNEVKDKGWVQRGFEHEVTALQHVHHPNVVSIYAHGLTPTGSPYLVMEFVEGRSLREVLDDGAITAERVARLLRQLAGALEAIHARNIWHRDVKPENVMLRHEGAPDEEPVLIDFSIAIVKDANETLHGLSRAAGTFDYMAPEQAIGYAQASSDIYSLAKLTMEMLTGQRLANLLPDAALDLPERIRELAESLNLGLSEDSAQILAAALEFDPGKRPQSVNAFADPIVRDLASGAQVRKS